MEFGKHVEKGLWAFADKTLPCVYGLALVVLVIRVLPASEYGALSVIQTVFTLASALGYALAFQPLTKYAAEKRDMQEYVAASLMIGSLFVVLASLLVLIFGEIIARSFDPDKTTNLSHLFHYLPFLIAAGTYRSFAISLLQAGYQISRIFWIDAAFFIGTPATICLIHAQGRFDAAEDVILSMLAGLTLSTIVGLVFSWSSLPKKLSFRTTQISKVWNFGKFTFGGTTMYSLFSQMDVFFVTSYTGLVGAATYNAVKTLTRFFDMIAQVLHMFLVPFASSVSAGPQNDELRIGSEKAVCFSTLLLLPAFILMLLFPEWILSLLYLDKYNDGASIMRVLSFLAIILPWNGVVVSILTGIGEVKRAFYSSVALLVVALLGYVTLTPALGGLGASIALIASFMVVTVGLVIYVQRFVPLRLWGVIGRTRDVVAFFKKHVIRFMIRSRDKLWNK